MTRSAQATGLGSSCQRSGSAVVPFGLGVAASLAKASARPAERGASLRGSTPAHCASLATLTRVLRVASSPPGGGLSRRTRALSTSTETVASSPCALEGAASQRLTGWSCRWTWSPQVRAHWLVRRVRGVRAHRHDRRVRDHRHGSRGRQLRARRQDRRHERTGAASEFVEFEHTDLAGGARAPRLGRRASVFTRTGRAFAASKWKHPGTAVVVEHTGMAVHPSSCVHRQDHRCLAIGLAVQSHDSRKRQLDLWSQVP